MNSALRILSRGFKRFASVTLVVLILVFSIYVIIVDLSSSYTWYYPLHVVMTIGNYYPKLEQRIIIYDLEKNETFTTIYKGLSFTGIRVSPLSSGFAIVEYSGVNAYVLTVVIAALVVQIYLYSKCRRSASVLVFSLYVLSSISLLLTLFSILYYVDAGRDAGYFLRVLTVEDKLIGPIDTRNLSLGEPSGLAALLKVFKYAYTCQREYIYGVTLIRVEVKNQVKYIVPSLPLVYIGNLTRLGYTSTAYAYSGYAWCALLSTMELDGNYSIYKLEFTPNPGARAIPLLFLLPLIFLLMSTSNVVWIFVMLKKQLGTSSM